MSDKTQEDAEGDWEDEGGSPAPEPPQKTSKGSEIPVPRRKAIVAGFRRIVAPVKKR